MTETIENKTFDEIQIGDAASLTRVLRPEDIETWAAVTGNLNLIDLDPTALDSSMFPYGGGQAMWAATLFSTVAGTRKRVESPEGALAGKKALVVGIANN